MINVAAKQKHIGELAKKNHELRFKDFYRVICDETWLTAAWMRIRQNTGSKTAGVAGQTKNDVDETLIKELATKLKCGEYKPTPVRRVYIPKANGKVRPLGIPTIQDRIVQSALKMYLEPIYEMKFRNCSHGFRPKKSCITALSDTAMRSQRSTWIIEGDIKGCFDNIHHGKLLAILRKTIGDEKVIDLIAAFLSAGYLEQWNFHRTYSGTPQGGIISPLLANIYLAEMDTFLEETLGANTIESQKEANARRDPKYMQLAYQTGYIRKWLKAGTVDLTKWGKKWPMGDGLRQRLITKLKILEKEQHAIPILKFHAKIGYIRYADDYVIILQKHSKAEAEEVKEKVKIFSKAHLNLEQSEEKTRISHPSDTMTFLGYNLNSSGGKAKRLRLSIPKEAIDGVIAETKRLCDMHHMPEIDLFLKVNAKTRGWMNYYRYASAPSRTFAAIHDKIFWLVSHYLARKQQTSIASILKKYYRPVTINGRTRKTLSIPMKEKAIFLWMFPPKKESIYRAGWTKSDVDTKPHIIHEWAKGHSINDKIETLESSDYKCSYCGNTENLEIHQVGGMKGLQTVKQKHMAGTAKQKVLLCKSCHLKIGHHGSFKPTNQGKNAA
jgi:group II intron reverse transcriptase/maturase